MIQFKQVICRLGDQQFCFNVQIPVYLRECVHTPACACTPVMTVACLNVRACACTPGMCARVHVRLA